MEVLFVNYVKTDIVINDGQKLGQVSNVSNGNPRKHKIQPASITISMVQCGSGILYSDKMKNVELINKYRCYFALSMYEIGYTDVIAIDIEDNNQPLVSKLYRTSEVEKNEIDTIVGKIMEEIRDSYRNQFKIFVSSVIGK